MNVIEARFENRGATRYVLEISDARHCEIDMSQENGERGREKEIARTNGGKRKGVRGRTTNGERSIGTLWYRAAAPKAQESP